MTRIKDSVPEWVDMVGILNNQITFFEAGNTVKPTGQNSAKATIAWLKFLYHERDELSSHLEDFKRYS
jgi:hypothetical protein